MNKSDDHIAETIVSLDAPAVRRLAQTPGFTYRQIAGLLRVHLNELYQFMHTHKIPITKRTGLQINNADFTFENVRMLALKENASYLSIAREIGVSNKTIKRFMMKHGITMTQPRNRSASVRAMEQARSDSSDRISVQSLVNP